jgi:hypothetical protein
MRQPAVSVEPLTVEKAIAAEAAKGVGKKVAPIVAVGTLT